MFQHVRTGYDTINVTLKRIHYVKNNESDIATDSDNITKIVEVYDVEQVVRSLNYGDGINVLGNHFLTGIYTDNVEPHDNTVSNRGLLSVLI